jgi:hypothetical protein
VAWQLHYSAVDGAHSGVYGYAKIEGVIYKRMEQGLWYPITAGKLRFRCCYCGLVHVFKFRKSHKKTLEMGLMIQGSVDHRATRKARNNKVFPFVTA